MTESTFYEVAAASHQLSFDRIWIVEKPLWIPPPSIENDGLSLLFLFATDCSFCSSLSLARSLFS